APGAGESCHAIRPGGSGRVVHLSPEAGRLVLRRGEDRHAGLRPLLAQPREAALKLDAAVTAGPKRGATLARELEQAGFDGFWTTEIQHDPFLPLAGAAAATTRIELGTAIATAFTRSPMVTAVAAWDLQRASGGRFLLGLGTQVRAHNERRFSVPFPDAPARQL